MQFEIEYFSAVFATLLHPKLQLCAGGSPCHFPCRITSRADFDARASVDGFSLELCHVAAFSHVVLHFQSWLQPTHWTFNHPDQAELHVCGAQANLATFLEKIWNR